MSESQENRNESLIRVAKESIDAEARYYDADGIPLTVDRLGQLTVMKELHDRMIANKPSPARRKGTSHHTELDSFISHINRMKESSTTIWANIDRCVFTAIYNYDPEGSKQDAAGWMDHVAKYTCPISPEWEAWSDMQNNSMSQSQFAEWIDEHIDDLVESEGFPKPIEVEEMVRNLQIHTKGQYSKKIDPTTGQYALVCKEEHTTDSTKIYRAFKVALRVFDGGDKYGVDIRLRFRMEDKAPRFSYTMHRHEELKRDAFGEMRTTIAEQTERPVFTGVHSV